MILQREHYNIETIIGNDTTSRTLQHRTKSIDPMNHYHLDGTRHYDKESTKQY
jgi:hypothetical protein